MKEWRLFKRAFHDLYQLGKKYYVLLFIRSLATQSIPFIGFIYMTKIVDSLTNNEIRNISVFIFQYLLILLFLQLFAGIIQPLEEKEDVLFQRKIFAQSYKKMMTMRFQYAESSDVREQMERINQGNMSNQSSLPIINVRIKHSLPNLVTIVWSCVLLFPLFSLTDLDVLSPYPWLRPTLVMTLLVFLLGSSVCAQVSVSKKNGRNISKMIRALQHYNALFFYEESILQDVNSGKEIRLYDLVPKMIENTEADTRAMTQIISLNYKQFKKWMLATAGIFQTMTYFTYAYIGALVLLGALPIALIIQLSSALSQVITALPDLIQHMMMLFSSPEGLADYYDFMDLPDEEVVGSLPVEKRLDNEYQLSVNGLSFAYPESKEHVLKNITESFEVGKKYAIVGENGSGKTTFIKLLTRLYDPTEGTIQLNKIDSRKYDLKEYFDLFGVVFQDYHLLGFSIGQNVSVEPSFEERKVLTTLDKVGAGEFVRTLPHITNTFLGTEFDDSGVNVSGGQEQKIAIARALYKDAPIMVLDEPTAALDPLTEFEIYQNFDSLVEDKTAFYISHRLSSSRFCDEILVFDKGEIIQRGSHDELVQKEGKYQELWSAQAAYYQ